MKISEMIEHLNELKNEFGDKEIVLSIKGYNEYTDHTDWTYNFNHPGFDIDNVYDEDNEFNGEEYCVCSMSI